MLKSRIVKFEGVELMSKAVPGVVRCSAVAAAPAAAPAAAAGTITEAYALAAAGCAAEAGSGAAAAAPAAAVGKPSRAGTFARICDSSSELSAAYNGQAGVQMHACCIEAIT